MKDGWVDSWRGKEYLLIVVVFYLVKGSGTLRVFMGGRAVKGMCAQL